MIVIPHPLKNRLLKVVSGLSLFAAVSVAAAPHTHGEGTLQVLQAGSDWQLVLQLPAADVLGFEHEPETTAERRQFEKAESSLSHFKDIFGIDAKCSVVDTTMESPWQEATEHESVDHETDHHDADEHDEHGHHEEHEEHEEHGKEDKHATHSDFRVAYLLTCESPISKVEVTGFGLWPSVSMLRATWITQTNQQAFIIKASEPSFEIK
jgi:hypothetical protein